MNRSKSILVITSTFPRWINDSTPPFVMELSRRLCKKNIHIDILAPHAPQAKRKEIMYGMTVYRYKYFFNNWQLLAYQGGILARLKDNQSLCFLLPFFLLSQAISIFKLLRNNNYDLIHAHWLIPQGLLAVVMSKLFKVKPKILCTSHGGDLFALQSAFFTKIKQWVLANCDGATVVSEYMRKTCRQIKNIEEKLYVCPMGVDLINTFKPAEQIARDMNQILFVGRLVEKKGLTFLLDAMALLHGKFPQLKLLIIGDGPEKDSLQAQCRRLNIENRIQFLGALNQKQLAMIYSSAGIFVMPSVVDSTNDQEGLGLVAIEAMGCGCAVIASDLPAIKDIIEHNINGLVVKPGDKNQLASAIEHLMTDENLRNMIASRARASVIEKFDWQIITNQYMDIIDTICKP